MSRLLNKKANIIENHGSNNKYSFYIQHEPRNEMLFIILCRNYS